MNRAGSSARAKARQLNKQRLQKVGTITATAGSVGAFLGSTDTLGMAVAGAVLGAAGGATVGFRWVPNAGKRWRQGADGERRTGKILRPLQREGWHLHNDLSIPGSRANLDHLWVVPSGQAVILGDTKAWHADRAPVRFFNDNLYYGPWCQDRSVQTIEWEASRVRDALDVSVLSVMVLDGAKIDRRYHPGGFIKINARFWVIEQVHLLDVLRSLSDFTPDARAARKLSNRVTKEFPAYSRAGGK